MIKVQSFRIEDTEALNVFMEKHPPRSTEKQSGLVFHNGFFIVIYDDGRENPNEMKSLARSLAEGERHKKFLSEHSLLEAKAALKALEIPGYKQGMTKEQLRKLIEKDSNVKDYIPAEQLNSLHAQLESLSGQILMDEHEIKRLELSAEAYKKLAEEK